MPSICHDGEMSGRPFMALRTAIVALALAASAASASAAENIAVTVKEMAFSPAKIEAHVGDTIEWTNGDFVTHTATATDKSWDVVVPAGKNGTLLLIKDGTVDYFCRFHPMMKGTITVAK
jgi:plastocyanin